MSKYTLYLGDCLEVMRGLEAESVHCVVTSPPYFNLRDYQIDGQIGLEESPDEYVAKLVAVFREVWRVLRDDGTVWLNLGDSYAATSRSSGASMSSTLATKPTAKKTTAQRNMGTRKTTITAGLKPKDLIGIPWRVAFALQADGWYLRQDIIWHKPNPMPESVTDRCTKAHEYIFLLSKSARYYYDNEAVKEDAVEGVDLGILRSKKQAVCNHPSIAKRQLANVDSTNAGNGKRNRRSVWTVSTKPYAEAHFATYPPELITPCILAGCPEQACPKCGKGWERVVEKEGERKTHGQNKVADDAKGRHGKTSIYNTSSVPILTTLGFRPSCDCGETESVGGVVLDPFNGSGTTGEVAILNGRRYVGIELNPDYLELAKRRLESTTIKRGNATGKSIKATAKERATGQISLFEVTP